MTRMARAKRTKLQMAEDIAIAMASSMSMPGKLSVLNSACWNWTGLDGKYEGCPYWTPAALEAFAVAGARGLRHEHAVPRRVFHRLVFALQHPTAEATFELCDRMLLGVVVTLDEDRVLNAGLRQRMPPEFDDPSSPEFRDPWLRYKRKRIAVVRTTASGVIPAFEMPE